jgi:hypothetical protein
MRPQPHVVSPVVSLWRGRFANRFSSAVVVGRQRLESALQNSARNKPERRTRLAGPSAVSDESN